MYMHTCTHTTCTHRLMHSDTHMHAHTHKETLLLTQWGFLGRFPSSVNRACGDKVGVGRSHGSLGARGGAESSVIWEGTGNPLQYSCLENPMDGKAWWATVQGVAKSRTQLSNFTFFPLFFFCCQRRGGAWVSTCLDGRGERKGRDLKSSTVKCLKWPETH